MQASIPAKHDKRVDPSRNKIVGKPKKGKVMEELLKVLVLITAVLVCCRLVDYCWPVEDPRYDGEFTVDEVTVATYSYNFEPLSEVNSRGLSKTLSDDDFRKFMKGDKVTIEGTARENFGPPKLALMDTPEDIERKKSNLFNRTLGTVIDNRIDQGKFSKKKPHNKNSDI